MKNSNLIFLAILLSACSKKNEVITEENIETNLSSSLEYKQVDGISPNLLSLDVYYNSAIDLKKPVIIYVHGGAWCIGDKSNQLENKINLFQSLGYVFVSINYRLSPFPYELNNPNRIRYPTHNRDVADAIKWVVDNIDQYGGESSKIVLLGHSAGAHLVSLTATNSGFLTNVGLSFSAIKGIAAIDTEGYNILSEVQDNNNLYINAFGTDSILNTQASPVLNIVNGPSYPKFFIAKRGNPNRMAVANNFINSLQQNGVAVSSVDGSIYDHDGINEAIGKPGEELITEALKQFFADCFE